MKHLKISASLMISILLSGCYWFPDSHYDEYQNQYGTQSETGIHDKFKQTNNGVNNYGLHSYQDSSDVDHEKNIVKVDS